MFPVHHIFFMICEVLTTKGGISFFVRMDPSVYTIHTKIDKSLVDMFKDAIGKLSVTMADSMIISPNHFGTEQKELDRGRSVRTCSMFAKFVRDACNRCLDNLIRVLGSPELTTIL
jgi:hypothetical protein